MVAPWEKPVPPSAVPLNVFLSVVLRQGERPVLQVQARLSSLRPWVVVLSECVVPRGVIGVPLARLMVRAAATCGQQFLVVVAEPPTFLLVARHAVVA